MWSRLTISMQSTSIRALTVLKSEKRLVITAARPVVRRKAREMATELVTVVAMVKALGGQGRKDLQVKVIMVMEGQMMEATDQMEMVMSSHRTHSSSQVTS